SSTPRLRRESQWSARWRCRRCSTQVELRLASCGTHVALDVNARHFRSTALPQALARLANAGGKNNFRVERADMSGRLELVLEFIKRELIDPASRLVSRLPSGLAGGVRALGVAALR